VCKNRINTPVNAMRKDAQRIENNMKIPALLVLLLPLSGCTFLGYATDIVVDNQNSDNSLTKQGLEADIELLRHALGGHPPVQSQPGNCNDLSGLERTECLKVADQLNKSIAKHRDK
jgi:hypothetical protein